MTYSVEEHLWIPMGDGCRLGARLWKPDSADTSPVPVILEYIPYRKRDGTRERDEPMHSYFAQNGYAAVRVDMRGSGESDGHLADEYLQQEQDDALEVMRWLAAQPWCNGRIGMMGKSWGGFNSLQVAMRHPPELKAIITVYSTDNRYAGDIHYMGGCLLNDNLWWGSIMMMFQSRPPDPAIVGSAWREIWMERLKSLPFFQAQWLEHQTYDAYWKHGSVCEDYESIACPVLAVGGWADSYTNTVPSLLEHLSVPVRGIIGPWGHVYPHDGVPGPAIGFLQEALRWWDKWLKDEETGVMDDPALRLWLEDPMPPSTTREQSAGHWIGVPNWPDKDMEVQSLFFGKEGRLSTGTPQSEQNTDVWTVRSPQSHGRTGGEWMGVGCPGEMPADQRLDDGEALVFETAPLESDVSVVGRPEVRLRLSTDVAEAQIVARLSEVLPDGQVTRVSYQVLNLTHRNGHENPECLVPGEVYDVTVPLKVCGHRFAAGNRIRIAIGTAFWPLIWPAPYAATLSVHSGSTFILPVLDATRCSSQPVHFKAPEQGDQAPLSQISIGTLRRYSMQDWVGGSMDYVTDAVGGVFGSGVFRYDETDTTVEHNLKRHLSVHDGDPLSARYELTQFYHLARPGQDVTLDLKSEMTCDKENFFLKAHLLVEEEGRIVFEQDYDRVIKRNFL